MDVVILGAGQTGRGLIAPILQRNDISFVFTDKDRGLVDKLNTDKRYILEDFNSYRTIEFEDVKALHFDIENEEIIQQIANADVVTTSIFVNNLVDIVPVLKKAISQRTKPEKLIVLCIENGIDVTKTLDGADLDAEISAGVVFTTTVQEDNLDLIGEFNFEVPIDGNRVSRDLNIKGLPFIDDYLDLIQRKIYSYNFLSAAYSYLGFYENYAYIGEAANYPPISQFVGELLPSLNEVIAEKFSITVQEQTSFSDNAVTKFQNPKIVDPIERNARDAHRKLRPNERLLIPFQFVKNAGKNIEPFLILISAAVHYGIKAEEWSLEDLKKELSDTLNEEELEVIEEYVRAFLDNVSIEKILNQ